MIRKSGNRFSEKTMPRQRPTGDDLTQQFETLARKINCEEGGRERFKARSFGAAVSF
jgi:hypothetical protein